jgi:hypothetical protein
VRFRFDEDLRNKLRASFKRVRLVGRHKGRGVTRPASRRTLKLYATAREWQRDLNRVVSVKTSRFTSEADPQATATPKQNAPGCS